MRAKLCKHLRNPFRLPVRAGAAKDCSTCSVQRGTRTMKKPKRKVNVHASALGRLSAAVRLQRIPAERRQEIARHAAAVRWGKQEDGYARAPGKASSR